MSEPIILSPKVAEKLKTIANANKCNVSSLADKIIESYCQQEQNKHSTLQHSLFFKNNIVYKALYFETSAVNSIQIAFWITIPSFLLFISAYLNISYIEKEILAIFATSLSFIYLCIALIIDLIFKKTKIINTPNKTISPVIELYNASILICSSILGFIILYALISIIDKGFTLLLISIFFIVFALIIILLYSVILLRHAQKDLPPSLTRAAVDMCSLNTYIKNLKMDI